MPRRTQPAPARIRCSGCAPTSSSWRCSAPAATTPSACSTTATASASSRYVRQMLSRHSRQDAEDVLQDVFVRAYGALRSDGARSTCARGSTASRTTAASTTCAGRARRPAEIFEMSRTPLLDPVDEAQRREDLKRLVADVGRLPEQQRSALLMREIDGMSYADLAAALDVTVPAVKSLLVRARVGLVEAQESRDADCAEIRRDLLASYDRGVKASGRARRHMRECEGCREYRGALKGVRRSFAALTPAAPARSRCWPSCSARRRGRRRGRHGRRRRRRALAGGAATATACKVAAVVCATAITAGGAVEVRNLARDDGPANARPAAAEKVARAPGRPAGREPPRSAPRRPPCRPARDHARTFGRGDGRGPGGRDPRAPPRPARRSSRSRPPRRPGRHPGAGRRRRRARSRSTTTLRPARAAPIAPGRARRRGRHDEPAGHRAPATHGAAGRDGRRPRRPRRSSAAADGHDAAPAGPLAEPRRHRRPAGGARRVRRLPALPGNVISSGGATSRVVAGHRDVDLAASRR